MKQYLITQYGAVQSDRLQTRAIQAAIDDCFLSGGGEVVVPEGIWRTGGIRLRSHVTLHLLCGAVLEGSTDPEDYLAWREDPLEPVDGITEKEPERYRSALNTAEQSMASVMSTALSRLNSFLDSELEQLLCFDTEIDAEKFCNEK